jgi:hypothetical protein
MAPGEVALLVPLASGRLLTGCLPSSLLRRRWGGSGRAAGWVRGDKQSPGNAGALRLAGGPRALRSVSRSDRIGAALGRQRRKMAGAIVARGNAAGLGP